MKAIGVFRCYNDTMTGNAMTCVYRRFGQRKRYYQTHRLKEWRAFLRELRRKGYHTI